MKPFVLFASLFVAVLAMTALSVDVEGSATARNVGVYWAGPESYAKLDALGNDLIVSNFAVDTRVRLYWARRNNQKLILFNSAWVDDSVAGGRVNTSQVCDDIATVKGDPALWGYYLIDEPSRHIYASGASNPTSVSTMQTLNKTVKRCDPGARTLATILPGGGFGTSANNFGPDVADIVNFNTYFKAPDGAHFEWITTSVLPNAIKIARQRDPDVKFWAGLQTFGVNASSSKISIPTSAEVKKSIDLTMQTYERLKVPLDGALFFLWDKKFDSDVSTLTDDLRSHRDYWSLIDYMGDDLPPVSGDDAARGAEANSAAAVADREWISPSRGLIAFQPCTDFSPRLFVEGVVTAVDATTGKVSIGDKSWVLGDTTAIWTLDQATRLNGDTIQKGAYVKAFAKRDRTLNQEACKVLVKPVFNLEFTVLKVTKRRDLVFGGAVVDVRQGVEEAGQAALPYKTIEIDGAMDTNIRFRNPEGTPALDVTVDDIWPGSLLMVAEAFIGGSSTNLRAVDLAILPNNTGNIDITGPALNGRFPAISRETPPRKITSIEAADQMQAYYNGKDKTGRVVKIALPRTSIQPQGKYDFVGAYKSIAGNVVATVAIQANVVFNTIVTDVQGGGLTLKVMGPEFLQPDTSVITVSLSDAAVLEVNDAGAIVPLSLSKISDFSTVQFNGYWTANKTFKATRAVFLYVAPPVP